MNKVRLYEFGSGIITTIPATELASGFVRARVQGVEGEVYVNAEEAARRLPTHHRHPPFPPEYRDIFEELSETFRDVYRKTPEEWEDGFRYDTNPDGQIWLWLAMATAFRTLTETKHLSNDRKKDYFDIVLSVFNNGPDVALETVELRATSKGEAGRIVRRIVDDCPRIGGCDGP